MKSLRIIPDKQFLKLAAILSLFSAIFLQVSCEPEMPEFRPEPGDADFSTFIAVGCSKTAGFANNELYKSGQIVSFPNILSRQLLHVSGSEFKQPLMLDEFGMGNKMVLRYSMDCHGDSVFMPTMVEELPDEANTSNIFETEGPFQNFGVPRARTEQVLMPLNTTSSPFSVYFGRFASSASTTLIDDAYDTRPTFFSLWLGLSDLTEYAITGGGPEQSITDSEQFQASIELILKKLSQHTGNGIIANIPDIFSFPFFNHIDADKLRALDSLHPDGKRQLNPTEIVLLSALSDIDCLNWGSEEHPLPENHYLSDAQIEMIKSRQIAFNAIIEDKATQYDLAFLNTDALYKGIAQGMAFEGLSFSNQYISGGFYSLDGINLSRRGNAIVANAFIEAINLKYKSTIPKVSITQFQGIEFP